MRKQFNSVFLTITVVFIIFWIITEVFNYISNKGIFFILYTSGAWLLAYVSAIAYLKIVEFLFLLSLKVQKLFYGIIFIFLAPLLYNYLEIVKSSDPGLRLKYRLPKDLFTIDICLIIVMIGMLCISLYSKKYQQALANFIKNSNDTPSSPSNTILIEPELLLGQGTSIIDRVIKSLFYRANRSEKTARLSLVLIVLLVFIGGSISIGTIALDQFTKLRQMEKVRQDMISVADKLALNSLFIECLNSKDSLEKVAIKHDSTIAKSIQTTIETTFGKLDDTKSYKQLLENIEKKESYNVSEIIMRVAIAALTFFLVQVFLRIYKYNQQQTTSLHTKAEVLELFNEAGADKKKLRELLASKIEENPKFGNTPTTPIEQIINIADKAKSNGAGS